MRLIFPWMVMVAGTLLLAACYQQPVLSPQRPLRCDPAATEGECPAGYTCLDIRVCAPNICRESEECPAGLVCANRLCMVPPPDAGGPDSGGVNDGGLVPPIGLDGGAADSPGLEVSGDAADAAAPDVSTPLDGGQG